MNFVTTAPAAKNAAASLAKTVADRPDRAAAILLAADLLRPSLEGGRAISMNDFRAAVVQAFGGTEAEGFWFWKDAFDACEAQLFFLRKFEPTIVSRSGSTVSALGMIMKVAKLMPTRMLAEALALADKNTRAVFVVKECASRAAVRVPTASVMLHEGTIEPRVRLVRPIDETRIGLDPLPETHWRSVERDMFARLWQAEVGNVPEFSISTFHSVTGFLQPIRRRLPMHVRPNGPESGSGAAGKRVAFVAALVMSRICDRVLSHRRSTAYAQHAVRPPREVS